MVSIWSIVAYYLLPVPLVLFGLLSLPLPKSLRRGILFFVHRIFDLPVLGVFKLLHVALGLTGLVLLASMRQVSIIHQLEQVAVFATPNVEIGHLSKRWRAERNVWMSAFTFASWLMLSALAREAVARLQLQDRWDELEQAEPPSELTTTAPSGPREVCSSEHRPSTQISPDKAKPAAPTGQEDGVELTNGGTKKDL